MTDEELEKQIKFAFETIMRRALSEDLENIGLNDAEISFIENVYSMVLEKTVSAG